MNEDIVTNSFLATYGIAENWVKNNSGKVYIDNTRVHHYQAGLASVATGVFLKLFADKKYDKLADVLIGAGAGAVWHDREDLLTDLGNRQSIFKYL